MSRMMFFAKRYWSLLAAFLVLVIMMFADSFTGDLSDLKNPAVGVWLLCSSYAALAALCLGLAVHSWQMQRRHTRNIWRLAFWTHVLVLPVLCATVLGLDVIQVDTYDLAIIERQFQGLHWHSGDLKDHLISFVPLNLILILVWAAISVVKNAPSGSDPRHA